MPMAAFLKMNEEREALGHAPAANPRNVAAGTIRTIEPNVVAQRRLDFYGYFALQLAAGAEGENVFATQVETLDALTAAGFRVNPHREALRRSISCRHLSRGRKSSGRRWGMRSTAW